MGRGTAAYRYPPISFHFLYLREASKDCVGIGQVPESLDGRALLTRNLCRPPDRRRATGDELRSYARQISE
jgi:hypothetical protein